MHTYLIRTAASFAGGLIGTFSFVAIYFVTLILLPGSDYNPTAGTTMIFMIFTGTILNNVVSTELISLSQSKKYIRIKSSIFQSFILNMIMFISSLPFYFILDNIQQFSIIYIIMSTLASFIMMEAYAINGSFILTGLYGNIIGAFLVTAILLQLSLNITDFTYVFFFIMPVINTTLTICTITTEFIAGEIMRSTMKNPLDINANVGGD